MKDISNEIIDLLDSVQVFHHISVSVALLGANDLLKQSDEEMIKILDLLRSIVKESFDE